MRTGRSNGTDTYTYVYNGSQLVQLTKGTDTLYFTYDATGTPVSLNYNGTTYYYITNIQGDVTAIWKEDGSLVVDYMYDPWGHHIDSWKAGTIGTTLYQLNPLRYRGYVYDIETGLYYLQSRYYNPELGRFISADAVTSTGQGFFGNNMFTYCLNNPVLYLDISGNSAALPPIVTNGIELPVGGGWPVEINGTLYFYAVGFSPKGDLYEYWFNADGDLIRARHHSNHGNATKHENPHDHEGTKGKKGKNSLKKEQLPVDENFSSPNRILGSTIKRRQTVSAPQVLDNAATATTTAIVVSFAYYALKWTIAAFFAPITGGGSLGIAATTP